MRLQTIVYVTDMERSRGWYGSVLGVEPSFISDMWTPFAVGGAVLALHLAGDLGEAGRVELSLVADGRLEHVVDRLDELGVAVERGITDETFGRSILLRDPDGNAVQVNEHD
jgi:catechol-2,3-dioxygenase